MIARRRALYLLFVFCVAFYVRLDAVSTHIRGHPDPEKRLLGDEPGYQYLALRWADGKTFDWPARMPLYPMMLGTVYFFVGPQVDLATYFQALLGAVTVLLFWAIIRRHLGDAVACIASTLVALHSGIVGLSARILSENLYIPLLLLVGLGLLELDRSPRPRNALFFGALVALSVYCRPTGALLFVVVPALGLLRRWGPGLTARLTFLGAATIAVLLLPWTYHNWRTYGVVHPLTPSTAVLWQGSPEYYELMRQGRSYLDIWSNELNAEVNGGHDVTQWEGDRYFTRRALASIREAPLTYAWYCLQKVVYGLVGHPTADWPFVGMVNRWGQLKWSLYLVWPAMCLLAAVGVPRRAWSELVPYGLLIAYFTAVHAIAWTEARLVMPLHPFLTLFLACFLVRVSRTGDSPRVPSEPDDAGGKPVPAAVE